MKGSEQTKDSIAQPGARSPEPDVVSRPEGIHLSELKTKLTDLREKSKTEARKLATLAEEPQWKYQSQFEKDQAIPTMDEVVSQVDLLVGQPGISDTDFLLQSKKILENANLLMSQTIHEQGALQGRESSLRQSLSSINEQLKELEARRGLGKIPAAVKKRPLLLQKVALQRQVDGLRDQEEAKEKITKQLEQRVEPLRKKRDDAVLAETERAMSDVKNGYEQIANQISNDPKVKEEIQGAYIQTVIAPKVEQITKERNHSPEKKNEFYSALNEYLTLRDESGVDKQQLETLSKKLNQFLTYQGGFSDLEYLLRPLQGSRDKDIIQSVVVSVAAEDVSGIRLAVADCFGDYDKSRKLESAIRRAICPTAGIRQTNNDSFGGKIFDTMDHRDEENFPNMDLWGLMKKSPKVNEIMGGLIETSDKRLYQALMKKSLTDTDGGYIDLLPHYPDPEVIRNLIILAATDNDRYRTYHANYALDHLAKRKDWKEILDKTEGAYPSVKPVRQILESWYVGMSPDSQMEGIQSAAGELSRSLYVDKSTDPQLANLAKKAMPNNLLLEILAVRDLTQHLETETIDNAGLFLEKLEKKLWEERNNHKGDRSFPYISGFSFHEAVRQQLLNSLDQEDAFTSEQPKPILKRFEVLSKLILENKEDYKFIDSLTDSHLIDSLKDPNKRGESALTFIQGFRQTEQLLSSESPVEINKDNWSVLLMAYVRAHNEVAGLPQFPASVLDRVNTLFDDPKVRDFCLGELGNQWRLYLKNDKPGEIPASLMLLPSFIEYCGSAGPLSQIESLGSLISGVDRAFSRGTTVDRTKAEICQGLSTMEEKLLREKWSNEDRADFYNISRDVLNAAPSIFSDCLSLFGDLSPSQLRQFTKEIYPLYRTKLVLMEKKDNQGSKSYDKQQLIQLRHDIRNFAGLIGSADKPFEVEKKRMLEEIRERFKDHFGIIKIPENFTQEHMRSFTNVSNYLANLHGRTPEKETVLGFYLSLMVNDQWDNFRHGENFEPDEYLTPEKSYVIRNFLRERQRLNPLTPENLGIQADQLPEFMKLLQQESQSLVIGNIETIDVKLANIILNLQGLEDPDLYPDNLDKQRLELLINWGNKKVGSVVARMYQKAVNPERQVQFSDEDTRLQQQILQIIQESGLTFAPQILKQHFQDGIRSLSTVVNLLSFVRETGAEAEISSLRRFLEPPVRVIEVFNRLGEDFKPTSGALALSQDLSYLDNLIVKREDELSPEEKTTLTEYTGRVREQVVKLETVYGQIKSKFGSLKQGTSTSGNPLLQDKLAQIDKVINTQATQQVITSTATNNLNIIIENIRECLSCTRDGSNNDTDLTFGDMNKFYLYSQTEAQEKGSISDELLFVEPITRADGTQEVAFIMDRVYGTNTPIILGNQIDAVFKKYRTIKQQFPEARLSVFVSDAAAPTGGVSQEMLIESLKAKGIVAKRESVEVNVLESAAGDHYVEFGGSARTAGKRESHGIIF